MSLKWKLPWYSGLQLSPDYWGGGREIALRLRLIKRYRDSQRTDKAPQREVGGDVINKVIQVSLPLNSRNKCCKHVGGREAKSEAETK